MKEGGNGTDVGRMIDFVMGIWGSTTDSLFCLKELWEVSDENEYSVNAMMGVNKVLGEHRGEAPNLPLTQSLGEF